MGEKETQKTAFIVKDSKSYVDAEEAWYRLTAKKEGSLLFIIVPRLVSTPAGSAKKQELLEVIDEDKWEDIIWFKSWSNNTKGDIKLRMRRNPFLKFFMKNREYFYNFIDRIRLDRIAKRYKPCKLVVSGHKNTQEHLAATLEPEALYLVDAGLSVLSRINSSGYVDYSKWFSFKKKPVGGLFYKLTGLKVFPRSKTTLFTAYADQLNTHHAIEKNTQDYKRLLIQNKATGDDVIWISSPIHEMVEEVTLHAYMDYMQATLNSLSIDGSNLIYIPHAKKEKPEDIKTIRDFLKCKTDERLLPVEVKMVKYSSLPNTCISPLSSALVNLDLLCEGKIRMISAWHYEFDCFKIWKEWKHDVKNNPKLHIEFLNILSCSPFFGLNKDKCSEKPLYKNFQDWQFVSSKSM